MKFKFFTTIFFVLVVTAISISATHFHFFKLERLRLIEINLEQNATLIIDSDLTLSKKEFLQKGEEYIDEIIGDDKVNMIVSIYNHDGSLLYENNNSIIFNGPSTISPDYKKWEDVETKDYFIKYLTLKDPAQRRIIRVGMILNQSLLRWKYLNQRIIIFAAIILVIISILSFFLTTILFRPIHALAVHVNAMAEKLESGETDDFKSIFHMSSHRFNDEFSDLLRSISKLAQKISASHNLTKKWLAIMAHELKTPLTILKNRVEMLSIDSTFDAKKIALVEEEMLRLENIIADFLEWAAFESDPIKPEIHAVCIRKRCEYVIQNFQSTFTEAKISHSLSTNDLKIFCNPIHFDQMLSNLITNSIKYAKGEVFVCSDDNYLIISDNGPGISSDVLEKLGTPFNHSRVDGVKGFGLGLAWVITICRKYGWEITIDNKSGNHIKIAFLQSNLT